MGPALRLTATSPRNSILETSVRAALIRAQQGVALATRGCAVRDRPYGRVLCALSRLRSADRHFPEKNANWNAGGPRGVAAGIENRLGLVAACALEATTGAMVTTASTVRNNRSLQLIEAILGQYASLIGSPAGGSNVTLTTEQRTKARADR